MELDRGEIGIIGEYYAICELFKNGFKPLQALNPK